MIIDESIIQNGITPQLLFRLINKHEEQFDRFKKLHNYYIGRHDILNRIRESDYTANNKMVCNHAKYIVDMTRSYLVGNPVTYNSSEDFNIEPLKDEYSEQDIPSVDSELIKDMCVYGRAYELVYSNGEGKPRSVCIAPFNAFVCYSQTAEKTPLIGIHYYKKYDVDGRAVGVVCNVYDDTYIYKFTAVQENFNALVHESTEQHYFDGVPLIEYRNNEDRQGDFEQLIPLIDGYNLLCSDRINDKEQFVESFLFLKGIEVDGEQSKKLKQEKILMGFDNSDAKYLSKVMTESDIKILRDDIKDDIHRFSMVPDLSDESFGNNLSGVAIKYKLLGFEQAVKNKERFFTRTLRRRFELYNKFLVLKSTMSIVPSHRVDIVYNYNLPANELEISQMIANLQDVVSAETLLSRLPFITDSKEEAELKRAEQAERQKRAIEETRELSERGY